MPEETSRGMVSARSGFTRGSGAGSYPVITPAGSARPRRLLHAGLARGIEIVRRLLERALLAPVPPVVMVHAGVALGRAVDRDHVPDAGLPVGRRPLHVVGPADRLVAGRLVLDE